MTTTTLQDSIARIRERLAALERRLEELTAKRRAVLADITLPEVTRETRLRSIGEGPEGLPAVVAEIEGLREELAAKEARREAERPTKQAQKVAEREVKALIREIEERKAAEACAQLRPALALALQAVERAARVRREHWQLQAKVRARCERAEIEVPEIPALPAIPAELGRLAAALAEALVLVHTGGGRTAPPAVDGAMSARINAVLEFSKVLEQELARALKVKVAALLE